jgi:hypothetical protein
MTHERRRTGQTPSVGEQAGVCWISPRLRSRTERFAMETSSLLPKGPLNPKSHSPICVRTDSALATGLG